MCLWDGVEEPCWVNHDNRNDRDFFCWSIEPSEPQPEEGPENPEDGRGLGEYTKPSSTRKAPEEYSDERSCAEGASDRFFWYGDTSFLSGRRNAV